MSALLQEIISLLVSGITGLASGIGSGLSSLVQSIFLEQGTEGAMQLSTFGGLIVVFAGEVIARNHGDMVFEQRKKSGRLKRQSELKAKLSLARCNA